MMQKKLTQEKLKELINYDPETGIFTWRINRTNGVKKGDIAGCQHHSGYWWLHILSVGYQASRIAWLYMEGYFPENEVDHRNRIRNDNKWSNLRHVSHACNMMNQKVRTDNKTGVSGVVKGKYKVQINVHGKRIVVGSFMKKKDAVMARWEAEKKYEFSDCHTTSSAYLWLKERGLL